MAPKIAFEIKDLDPTIDKDELLEELKKKLEIEKHNIEVKTMRFGYGGTKTAIISIPASEAEKLGEGTKIRIGYTNCRIQRALNIVRCFKCHAYGHMSYTCTLDLKGQELCRRCDGVGHQINGCAAIRCCVLCVREGVPAARAEHVAGAVNCPQYKKYLQLLVGRLPQNSS